MQNQNKEPKIPKLKVVFHGAKGEVLTVEAPNFRDALKIQRDEKIKFQPVAVVFSSGKKLYYDENVMHTFMSSEEMSMVELLGFCECLGVYVNTKKLLTNNGVEVEEGQLWKKVNYERLHLIDDDAFVESEINDDIFKRLI